MKKLIPGFTTIDTVSMTPPYLKHVALVISVLYDVLKNKKFPVWNYFQFCLTGRQTKKNNKISRHMCDRDEFGDKVPLNGRFVFLFMLRFMFQI